MQRRYPRLPNTLPLFNKYPTFEDETGLKHITAIGGQYQFADADQLSRISITGRPPGCFAPPVTGLPMIETQPHLKVKLLCTWRGQKKGLNVGVLFFSTG